MGEKNRVGAKINVWNRQGENERKVKVEIDIGAKMGTPPRGGQLADTAFGMGAMRGYRPVVEMKRHGANGP